MAEWPSSPCQKQRSVRCFAECALLLTAAPTARTQEERSHQECFGRKLVTRLGLVATQAEALHRQFKTKKEALEKHSKGAIMAKYGNVAAEPDSDTLQLLMGQTEGYVEYNAAGRVIKGQQAKAGFHKALSLYARTMPASADEAMSRSLQGLANCLETCNDFI